MKWQTQREHSAAMKTTAYVAAFVATLVVACPLFAGASPPSMHDVLRATYGVHDLARVSISPDGAAAVWEDIFHPGADPSAARPRSEIYLQHDGQGTALHVLAGSAKGDETEPKWSPDGATIAFLVNAEKGPAQLYMTDASGAHPRRVASFEGSVQTLKWSPDGRYIGVLYIAHPHRKAGALAEGARTVGVIGSTVDEQRLCAVDVRNGALNVLTPPDVYVYEYAWSPDSNELAFTYAHGNGDNNWWIARLAAIDVKSKSMRDLYKPSEQINDPQWSPDGKRIAFVGGLMSDFGSVGGDVFVIDPASRRARDLAPKMRVSAASLRWIDDDRLYMSAHDRGNLHLFEIDMRGAITPLTGGQEAIRTWDAAQRGTRLAFVRTSFTTAPEVFLGNVRSPRQLSHVNTHAQRLWGRAVSLHWVNEGYHVRMVGWFNRYL